MALGAISALLGGLSVRALLGGLAVGALLAPASAAGCGFVAGYLGFDGEWIGAMVGLLLIIPLDVILRFATGGGEDEDGEATVGCIGKMLWPSSGGHLMFIPCWIIGVLGLPLTAIGLLAP